MMLDQLQPLADHLWQSTLFAAVAGLLTLVFGNNRAQIRYNLWLAASMKFLIPFSILINCGGYFGRHSAVRVASLPVVVEHFTESFIVSPSIVGAVTLTSSASSGNVICAVLGAIWAIGFIALVSSWWLRWRRVVAVLRAASPVHLPIDLKAMSSQAFIEPGVFGIFDPILLVPEGITEQLTLRQLEAILVHERCHVRRRDNVATAFHMVIEAVFWFHPVVWFLGARLTEERERACDEEVLRMGNDPAVYAEGILRVCELYLQSPLRCVSGVTGSNLKKRIRAIISGPTSVELTLPKKTVLAVAAICALAAPVFAGMIHGSPKPYVRATMTLQSPAGVNTPAVQTRPVEATAAFRSAAVQPQVPAAKPKEEPQAATAVDQGRRMLIFFFDLTGLTGEEVQRAIVAAKQYVDTQMGTGDLVSVVTASRAELSIVQDFTPDKKRAVEALDSIGLQRGQGNDRTLVGAGQRLAALQALSVAMTPIPNKKSVIYFSGSAQGTDTDDQLQLRATISAAIRANMSFYTVHVRGLQ